MVAARHRLVDHRVLSSLWSGAASAQDHRTFDCCKCGAVRRTEDRTGTAEARPAIADEEVGQPRVARDLGQCQHAQPDVGRRVEEEHGVLGLAVGDEAPHRGLRAARARERSECHAPTHCQQQRDHDHQPPRCPKLGPHPKPRRTHDQIRSQPSQGTRAAPPRGGCACPTWGASQPASRTAATVNRSNDAM